MSKDLREKAQKIAIDALKITSVNGSEYSAHVEVRVIEQALLEARQEALREAVEKLKWTGTTIITPTTVKAPEGAFILAVQNQYIAAIEKLMEEK